MSKTIQEIRKLKRIEDEVIGMTMEIVGTVWGIEGRNKGWPDSDHKLFNTTTVDIRNRSLKKIRKIYLRKLGDQKDAK